MKNLKFAIAAALVAACSAAAAEVIADARTTDGGTIRLADTRCPQDKRLQSATVTSARGAVLFGCWVIYDGSIMVAWEDGDKSLYEVGDFKYRDSFLKKNGIRKPGNT